MSSFYVPWRTEPAASTDITLPTIAEPRLESTPPSRMDIEEMLSDGRIDAARDAVAARLAADPADAETWFLHARILEIDAQLAASAEACDRAAALWPNIVPLRRLQLRLACIAANPDAAIPVLEALLTAQPDDPHLNGSLGELLARRGEHHRALPHLRIAAPVLLHENDTIWNYTAALALTGCYHELLDAQPLLDRMAAVSVAPYTPYRHLAAARLALQFDRQQTVQSQQAIEASPLWRDPTQTLGDIATAITTRTPFSLFCLDQELSYFICATSVPVHLLLRPPELSAMVSTVWSDWFGCSFEATAPADIALVARRVRSAIDEADLVGMPDAETLRLDNLHFGLLAEMRRAVSRRSDQALACSRIMRTLHETMPYLRPALQGLPFLGMVGAYPALAQRLGHFCGITETRTIPAPAADAASAEQALAEITVPFQGALFLVGVAGPVGPMFCGRIKKLGGIAIDIGVLASKWAGG